MAPRQRLSPSPSIEESAEIAEGSMSQPNASSSIPTAPLNERHPTSESSKSLEAEIARERHDIFNIFALALVVMSTALDWDVSLLINGYGPNVAWSGNYFFLNWATTALYFIADLVWVARVPICVKSPNVIIKHHYVAIAYLSGPILWPEFRWFMGAILSVEINTWFLILRRLAYKRTDKLPPLLVTAINQSFYWTWVIVRVFIYPAILLEFLRLAVERVTLTGIYWHWPMLMIPVHTALCCLNLKWSYDLFAPIVREWIGVGKNAGVATGL